MIAWLSVRSACLAIDPAHGRRARGGFSTSSVQLVQDLTDTMLEAPGSRAGSAADRRGLRVFTYNVDGLVGAYVNPELTLSEETQDGEEGCLSIPGLTFDCRRAFGVVARGFNMYGDPVVIEGTELMARCIQHETDHLDGIMFVDRLDPETRKAAIEGHSRGRVERAVGTGRQGLRTRCSAGGSDAVRLVFAGTPDVAVPSLRALIASRHQVIAVVTRPDAPTGRGRRVTASPVASVAEAEGIEVLKPTSPRDPDFLARLREIGPMRPVVAYGGLVPDEALAVPPRGWVNLHSRCCRPGGERRRSSGQSWPVTR